LHDIRLWLWCRWDLHSSGILCTKLPLCIVYSPKRTQISSSLLFNYFVDCIYTTVMEYR
jgi:hypothetical protein